MLFCPFFAPGLAKHLRALFLFSIYFLTDSRPYLASPLETIPVPMPTNAHQCPPMPTNAHPMPIKKALQCPSNALNDVMPSRRCLVRGSNHRAQ